ncbi:hypothetical protein MMC27_007500 [Xylographa pallens]|nr:hypothetical protein [Xylographa pallens]
MLKKLCLNRGDIPLEERTTGDKADIPKDWISKNSGKSSVASTIEKNRYVEGFKTSEDALSAPPKKSLQDSFKLPPAQIRRLKSNAIRKEDIQELKTVVTQNSGSWSNDWRLAFLELKQHYKADSTATRKPLLITYKLPRNALVYRQVRAHDIPRPETWSSFTFTAHVKGLAQSKVSRLMHRHLYRNQTTHTDAVQTAIMQLFEDKSSRPYLSTEAFNIALSFCYKHSNISNARKLFNMMDDTHVTISAETFNIMLRGAAVRKDLHTFTYLLRVMTRRGVSPNGDTWIAFLMVIKDKHTKLFVTRYMREAGMLKDAAMLQPVVDKIVYIELSSHLAHDQDLDSFVLLMDSRYGPDWLSVKTANQMCYILGENGLISQAVKVLGFMVDRGCQPDNITLHIFLGYCRRLRQPQRAIEFLQLFKSQYNVSVTEVEYDSLFMLAYRSKLVNCCRVIWRVACLEAAVTYRMQELVLRSLLCNTPEHPRTTTQQFIKTAGKVVVGIDIHFGTSSEESDPRWQTMQLLSQFSATGEDRERSLSLAKRMISRDLHATRHYKLAGNFNDLLAEALTLDRGWHNEEKEEKQQKPVMWKIRHAVHVGIQPHAKPVPRQSRVKPKLLRFLPT